MSDRYQLKETEEGVELINPEGDNIWSEEEAWTWPDKDGIEAMLDDASVSGGEKALFKTVLLGHERIRYDESE